MRNIGDPMSRIENWIEQSKRIGLLIRRSIRGGFVWGAGIPADPGVDLINPITKCAARKAARRIALFIIRFIRADPHHLGTTNKNPRRVSLSAAICKAAQRWKTGWVVFFMWKIWNVALTFAFLRDGEFLVCVLLLDFMCLHGSRWDVLGLGMGWNFDYWI